MENKKFIKLCIDTVVDYFNNRSDKTDNFVITENELFVVWYCKTLQNSKALLSTTVSEVGKQVY